MKLLLFLPLLSLLQESTANIGFMASPFDKLTSSGTTCDDGALSCEGRCNDNQHLPCSCDTVCVRYGDCCFDYKDVCGNPVDAERNGTTPSKCYALIQGSERLIDTCPDLYKDTSTAEKCLMADNLESPFQNIPFMDGKTKLSYRNKFCALCNNASDLTGWDMRMQCEDVSPFNRGLEDLVHKIKSGTCRSTPSRPPAAPSRPCITGAVQQCPPLTEPQLLKQCKAYASYVKTDKPWVTKYTNIHCLRCNNVNEDQCLAMMEVESGIIPPKVLNIFDTASLVWNPTMETWSLSFLLLDEYNVYSDLLVCQLEETSQSNCTSSHSSLDFKDHYPMSISVNWQLESVNDEWFLKPRMIKPARNHSWTLLGQFTVKKIKSFSRPSTTTSYFINTKKRLDYNEKRELIYIIRKNIKQFHQQNYPNIEVSGIITINDFHGVNARYDSENLHFNLQPVRDTGLRYAERMVGNSGTEVTCSLLLVLATINLLSY